MLEHFVIHHMAIRMVSTKTLDKTKPKVVIALDLPQRNWWKIFLVRAVIWLTMKCGPLFCPIDPYRHKIQNIEMS